MNMDGRKDFLTAKSNAQAGGGYMVWFEHPEGGLDTFPWTEHVVTAGPDIWIDVIDNWGSTEILVFAAEFFNELLTMYIVSKED